MKMIKVTEITQFDEVEILINPSQIELVRELWMDGDVVGSVVWFSNGFDIRIREIPSVLQARIEGVES